MAGSKLRIDASTIPLEQGLAALVDAAGDLGPAFRDIGEHLLNSHRDRWTREESPDGEPWVELSERYKRRKKRNRNKILTLDGHLSGLLRYDATATELQFGTDRIYGAVHQFGHEDVPARPYLGMTGEDLQEASQILVEHLTGAFEG